MTLGPNEASSNIQTISYSLLQNIAEGIGNIIGRTGIPMRIIEWLRNNGMIFSL